MNKAEFLHILRDRLSVLDEKELEDILSEYEQHIDMKAAGAMTEESAIADFGDIGELTAQILEAYHVRADFAREKEIREKGPGMMDTVMVTGNRRCLQKGRQTVPAGSEKQRPGCSEMDKEMRRRRPYSFFP